MFFIDLVTDKQYLKIDWRCTCQIYQGNKANYVILFPFLSKPIFNICFDLKVPELPLTSETNVGKFPPVHNLKRGDNRVDSSLL